MQTPTGKVFFSDRLEPTYNLAIENYLMEQVGPDEMYIYLWQNEKTVVIGRNQNPWKECRTDLMREDGIRLVRRASGGGAVYHDIGNLNFTFVARKPHYDVERHLGVILEAVRSFGIEADFTGRNDLHASGMKFSGNAFVNEKSVSMHHGTLLVDVDMSALGQYLSVSKLKIESKGVDSVRSRVVNLKSLAPDMTIPLLRDRIVEVFRSQFETDGQIHIVPETEVDASLYDRKEWIWGESPKFDITMEEKFPWGLIEISLSVRDGAVTEAGVFTDALQVDGFSELRELLVGKVFESEALAETVALSPLEEELKTDLMEWLKRVV